MTALSAGGAPASPGAADTYTLTAIVTDAMTGETGSRTATFTVTSTAADPDTASGDGG